MNLKNIANEINSIIEEKRKKIKLEFIEDGHIYYMEDQDGVVRSDFPSVSHVLEQFFTPFNADEKALQMCNGDVNEKIKLIEKWEYAGTYASNKGSRVHYELEKYAISKALRNKDIRMPIFECDAQQIVDSNNMILAGKQFIDLMFSRGCELIDTEMVLGSKELKYVGQADNFWLSYNKNKTDFGIIITDHKTNKVKNMEPQRYNDFLHEPFSDWISYALTHYYIQLSLYLRLFKDMLNGTKYENIQILGGILNSVRDDATFVEYRVPRVFIDKISNMDLSHYVSKK